MTPGPVNERVRTDWRRRVTWAIARGLAGGLVCAGIFRGLYHWVSPALAFGFVVVACGWALIVFERQRRELRRVDAELEAIRRALLEARERMP